MNLREVYRVRAFSKLIQSFPSLCVWGCGIFVFKDVS